MGHTIRTPNARYTEWVSMSYPAGVHKANWSEYCGRELYVYTSSSGEGEAQGERRNVVDDPSMVATVVQMRKQLHVGWRVAVGAEAWPAGLPDVPQTKLGPTLTLGSDACIHLFIYLTCYSSSRHELLTYLPLSAFVAGNCGPVAPGSPPAPPPARPMCTGTVAQCIINRGNVNFNALPEVPGFPKVVATALACEEQYLAQPTCVSGLWLSGSVQHGDCYLTAGLSPVPRHDFCGAKPGKTCVGFVRRNASEPSK